ncbi:GntR family transcriptional regulator [Enterococcus songbeiensis]|uniref:GntR family transcriptional regulator n=1 Tax=Enterococcus songbeiensis TaxID=2559927 RepID=UPI0010FA0EB5|nr:GntR family transcriptional regulator [Enterococcus songbeiensis]
MKVPKYQQIKNDLQQQIKSGRFENGDRFYTEAELITMYDASSITVIRAIKELAQEGYLVRYQGKGTFVSRSRKGKLVEFSDIELFPIDKDEVKVLSIEKGNDLIYRKKLNLRSSDYYYCIRRLRTADGVPYIYHKSFVPEQFIRKDYPDFSYYNSIYQRFRDDFNIHMNEELSAETNEIRFPTPKDVAELLQIDSHAPTVFQVKSTTLSISRQIAEYVETYKRWDFYKIEFSSVDYGK